MSRRDQQRLIGLLFLIVVPSVAFGAFYLATGTLTGALSLLFTMFLLLLGAMVFPLPFRDTGQVRYRSLSWATIMLLTINIAVFFIWQGRGYFQYLGYTGEDVLQEADYIYEFIRFNWTYGFRHSFIYGQESIGAFTSLTSMFMHGDLSHLAGNMFYLWAFGRRIEDATGSWRFLIFYLLCGMVANASFAVLSPPAPGDWDVPGVGASGAISGVMGAYLLLFPGRPVNCLWGLGVLVVRPVIVLVARIIENEKWSRWRWTFDIPAFILLGFYIWNNFIDGFQVILGSAELQGVNTIAHMMGFLAAITIFLFVRKDLLVRYMSGRRL